MNRQGTHSAGKNRQPAETDRKDGQTGQSARTARGAKPRSDLRRLLKTSVPLTTNRLFINILHSFEAFLVPLTLRRYGMSRDEALSIFGIQGCRNIENRAQKGKAGKINAGLFLVKYNNAQFFSEKEEGKAGEYAEQNAVFDG